MAIKTITPVKLTIDNASAFTYEAATSATDGFEIPFDYKDHRAVLMITSTEDSAAKTLTIKAGNGFQAGNDLVVSCAAAATMAVPLDSGRFKNVSGTYKGSIIAIPETVKVKCQLLYAQY